MSPRTRRLLPRGGMGESSSTSSLPQAPPIPASSTLSFPSSPSIPTASAASSTRTEIRQLGESSIRRIVAEQAICDLSSIVKELVDNALDAGSKSINSESNEILQIEFDCIRRVYRELLGFELISFSMPSPLLTSSSCLFFTLFCFFVSSLPLSPSLWSRVRDYWSFRWW